MFVSDGSRIPLVFMKLGRRFCIMKTSSRASIVLSESRRVHRPAAQTRETSLTTRRKPSILTDPRTNPTTASRFQTNASRASARKLQTKRHRNLLPTFSSQRFNGPVSHASGRGLSVMQVGVACPALQVGVACDSRAYKYSLQPFLSIRSEIWMFAPKISTVWEF